MYLEYTSYIMSGTMQSRGNLRNYVNFSNNLAITNQIIIDQKYKKIYGRNVCLTR